MNALSALVAAVVISAGNAAVARSYVPIGTGAASSREFMAVKPADRPNLPGMRPVEIELLEDAVRRKMPHSVGNSRAKAQASIVRNSLRNPVKQSHMLGILAEAVFLEVNSKWGYVRSPNASQHDVYTWLPGSKAPFTAQIKTHVSGDPLVYAADMLKDHRSALFVVPDDHVQALKAHWSSQLQAETLAGRTTNAIEAGRQLARIQGIGARYSDLSASLLRAARAAQREQYAGYISLGAAAALALGPLVWEALYTQSLTDQTLLRTAHAGSVFAAERATTYMLSRNTNTIYAFDSAADSSRLGTRAIKGSVRGNAITGIVLFGVDTAFSVYEYGGVRAFQNAGFYSGLGGSVSALSLCAIAGAAATESTVGNAYAGMVACLTAGTAAYVGGREGTRQLLEAVGPDFLHKEEDAALQGETRRIGDAIKSRQTI